MSDAVLQFLNMVSERYCEIELDKLERERILVNIAWAQLNGEITDEQAEEARQALRNDFRSGSEGR